MEMVPVTFVFDLNYFCPPFVTYIASKVRKFYMIEYDVKKP